MSKTWNWAMLGCGKIAEKFSEDLKLLPNANLYAAASRSAAKANLFAKDFGYQKTYGSYEEMLSDPQVDVVYVATPHSHHHEHTLLCLNHGKAVLCEKAFALNFDQAQEMIQCAQDRKIFLMEAFWTRFQPAFIKAMDIIQSGSMGKLKMMRSDFAFNGPYDPENRLYNLKLGGGSLLDIGIYPVFWALQTFGKPDVIKTAADFSPTSSEESIAIIFKYNSGEIATLQSSFAVYSDTQTEFWFEKGYLRVKRQGIEDIKFEIWNDDGTFESSPCVTDEGLGYHLEAAHVMECLDQKLTQSPMLPLSFSADLMATLDRVRQDAGIEFPGI